MACQNNVIFLEIDEERGKIEDEEEHTPNPQSRHKRDTNTTEIERRGEDKRGRLRVSKKIGDKSQTCKKNGRERNKA